jgi:hypothetical protein
LVFPAKRPGFDPTRPQGLRELRRKAMHREHPPRPDEFDEAQQIGEVGVVGQRKGRITLVSVNRAGLERPARDDGGAGAGDFFQVLPVS